MFILDYYYSYFSYYSTIITAANSPLKPLPVSTFQGYSHSPWKYIYTFNLISFLAAVVFSCPHHFSPLTFPSSFICKFFSLGKHLNFVWQSFLGGRQKFFGCHRSLPSFRCAPFLIFLGAIVALLGIVVIVLLVVVAENKQTNKKAMAKLNETKIPITDFLEAYRCQPCLYNSLLETYKNRVAREEAYQAIIRSLKIPQLTVLDIKLKIKSVRTVYSKELRILMRKKELNQCYEPKLFWFKRADSFLRSVSLSHYKRVSNTINIM